MSPTTSSGRPVSARRRSAGLKQQSRVGKPYKLSVESLDVAGGPGSPRRKPRRAGHRRLPSSPRSARTPRSPRSKHGRRPSTSKAHKRRKSRVIEAVADLEAKMTAVANDSGPPSPVASPRESAEPVQPPIPAAGMLSPHAEVPPFARSYSDVTGGRSPRRASQPLFSFPKDLVASSLPAGGPNGGDNPASAASVAESPDSQKSKPLDGDVVERLRKLLLTPGAPIHADPYALMQSPSPRPLYTAFGPPSPMPVADAQPVPTAMPAAVAAPEPAKELTEPFPGVSLRGNIHVVVRVRPMSSRETGKGEKCIIKVVNDSQVILRDPKPKHGQLYRSRESAFEYDVALGPGRSQEDVYRASARLLIEPVMRGENATVFAYGATGSGKTYTMVGVEGSAGVIPQVMRDLFLEAERRTQYNVEMILQYMEIYNEELRDLLNPTGAACSLREDAARGVVVCGVTEYTVSTPEEVYRLMRQGNERRTVDSHELNNQSSRSHAILQLRITQRKRDDGQKQRRVDVDDFEFTGEEEEQEIVSKLSLIDLAGSERAKSTGTIASKKMLREGAKINRSLLSLANCINALGHKTKKGLYVPYRDSKLTRLLKDSLGGGNRPSKTVMITNVSPSGARFDETRESLVYANRAKNIKVKVKSKGPALLSISDYRRLVSTLKTEVATLKTALNSEQVKLNEVVADAQAREKEAIAREELQAEDTAAAQASSDEPDDEAKPLSHAGVYVPPGASGADADDGADFKVRSLAAGSVSGRADARRTFEKLRRDLIENFEERMEVKKSLLELKETTLRNQLSVDQSTAAIRKWEIATLAIGNAHKVVGPKKRRKKSPAALSVKRGNSRKHANRRQTFQQSTISPRMSRALTEAREKRAGVKSSGSPVHVASSAGGSSSPGGVPRTQSTEDLPPENKDRSPSQAPVRRLLEELPEPPPDVAEAYRERATCLASLDDNHAMMNRLSERLRQLEHESEKVLADLHHMARSSEHEAIIRLTLERCAMELDNIELQMQANLLQMIVERQQDEIERQRLLLVQHGLADLPDQSNLMVVAEAAAVLSPRSGRKPRTPRTPRTPSGRRHGREGSAVPDNVMQLRLTSVDDNAAGTDGTDIVLSPRGRVREVAGE